MHKVHHSRHEAHTLGASTGNFVFTTSNDWAVSIVTFSNVDPTVPFSFANNSNSTSGAATAVPNTYPNTVDGLGVLICVGDSNVSEATAAIAGGVSANFTRRSNANNTTSFAFTDVYTNSADFAAVSLATNVLLGMTYDPAGGTLELQQVRPDPQRHRLHDRPCRRRG